MKLVFVYWGFENAGSMLDLKGYARAAVAAGAADDIEVRANLDQIEAVHGLLACAHARVPADQDRRNSDEIDDLHGSGRRFCSV